MTTTSRKARVAALQALFESNCVGHDPEECLRRLVEEQELPQEVVLPAHELIMGVVENKQRIDAAICKFAPAWPLEQVALIDRNILRLAIFEMLLNNKVPAKVAINEAVELAKMFGSGSSSKFVNGVLGSVYSESNKQSKREERDELRS
jgi:N utilization substance protein B